MWMAVFIVGAVLTVLGLVLVLPVGKYIPLMMVTGMFVGLFVRPERREAVDMGCSGLFWLILGVVIMGITRGHVHVHFLRWAGF